MGGESRGAERAIEQIQGFVAHHRIDVRVSPIEIVVVFVVRRFGLSFKFPFSPYEVQSVSK